jgi:endonuclease-3
MASLSVEMNVKGRKSEVDQDIRRKNKETLEEQRSRTAQVVERLKAAYPEARCSLHYRTVHELLVATILSAQCTDHRVNQVTQELFRRYRSPRDFAYADVAELAQAIHSCGYHNQKARSIQGASLKIVEKYGGEVPSTMEALVSLPGVGRKTANCILGEGYRIPAMVVDTHMIRIMNLLGFTRSRDPKVIEQELMDLVDKRDWVKLTHMVIEHGRKVCIARRPRCQDCCLNDLCPSAIPAETDEASRPDEQDTPAVLTS